VLKHIENVEKTGITHARCDDPFNYRRFVETKPWVLLGPGRYAHRLTPVSGTCVANVLEIKSLAQRILKPFLAQNPAADADCRVRSSSDFPSSSPCWDQWPRDATDMNISSDLISHGMQYKRTLMPSSEKDG
jgi:hypothetical protein